jgi:hypothetical protein
VTYKKGLGLDDWIYCTLYIHTVWDYRRYSYSIHYQFTAAHALGFSVFTSRILATDLSQSHCNFKSHVKTSWHSLIPFLPLFCSCQFRRLDATTLDYSRILRLLCFFYSCQSQSQSQSYFTTVGLPPITSSWRQASSNSRAVILFFQLDT